MKFPIKKTKSDQSFMLHKREWGVLCGFGGGHDICLMKEGSKSKCYCEEYSFDYHGIVNPLRGISGRENTFTPKRFFVIQMK